ncbi:MAG: hypothetical protein CM15mV4_0610 [Caudoviricetes sp.]|nr:MAG: hypothetical protein CM15mV4_0610 [Caudoviricetes sp.]
MEFKKPLKILEKLVCIEKIYEKFLDFITFF